MNRNASALCLSAMVVLGLAVGHLDARAQVPTELDALHFSSDIHTRLPAPGASVAILSDDSIAEFDVQAGTGEGADWLGALDSSDLDGFHGLDPVCGGSRLFSVSTHVEIAGTVMRPADVFTVGGNKVMDAAAEGIPEGVDVDAVSRDPLTCNLVFSIDVTAELGGVVYRPDDLIRRTGGGGFSLFLAGNAAGDVDALHLLPGGRVLLSLDADADLGSLIVQDDDVVERIPGTPEPDYVLAFSPRSVDASWEAADLDALWAMPAPLSGDFRWQDAEVEVFENAGSLVLTIERIDGAEGSVTVSYTTVDDTAVSGLDFLGSSGGVGFAEGQTTGTVGLTVLDNATVQNTRRFFVDLTAVTDGGLVAPTRVTVLIRDDENFLFADGFEN